MAKFKKATEDQGELRRFEVLSPIKFAGRVTKSGSVNLPVAVGEALEARGIVAPLGATDDESSKTGEQSKAPKADDAGSQAGAASNNPRDESGRSDAAGEAGGTASSAEKTEAAAPKQAPAGSAKQPATKTAGKTTSKKAK
jgi:hypothetical protein